MRRQIVSTKYNNYCYNIFIIIGINRDTALQINSVKPSLLTTKLAVLLIPDLY